MKLFKVQVIAPARRSYHRMIFILVSVMILVYVSHSCT
jgi:hypothetical protein